jgi:uncharacterized membrane protein YfcA
VTGFAFYALAILASFTVGLSKGGLPMVGVLGVPLLSLVISPVAAAALLLPIYIVSDMFGLWAYRREYDLRNLKILVPSAALGIFLGWASYAIISERIVTLLVGLIGLAYCINAVVKRGNVASRPSDIPRGVFWGTITGLTSFVSHTGGPPFQMYVLPQKLPKMVFAGTSTILFAIVNLLKVPPYAQLGQFNPANLEIAAMLSPIAVLGAWVGYKATRIIPEKLFFRIVEVALAVVSVRLIYTAAFPG